MTTQKMTAPEAEKSDQEYRAALTHVAAFGLLGERMPEPDTRTFHTGQQDVEKEAGQ